MSTETETETQTETQPEYSVLPDECTQRTVTVDGYSQHQDHQYRASQINHMMSILIDKAMERITSELGFNIFSRDLSDYEHAYAIIIPKDLYYEETPAAHDFRDTLQRWVKAIFNTHYIYIETEWRESSIDADSEFGGPLYEVDNCGSRSREVNIGPHLYFNCSMRCTATRRPPLDVAPATEVWPEGIPYKWSLISEEPKEGIVNYRTGEFMAAGDSGTTCSTLDCSPAAIDLAATVAAAIAYAEQQLADAHAIITAAPAAAPASAPVPVPAPVKELA